MRRARPLARLPTTRPAQGRAMPETLDTLLNFASALAVGLLIGAERGWHQRKIEEGGRVAGIRTFALSGLLGGFAQLLGAHFGEAAWAVVFAGFAALVITSYVIETEQHNDLGMTSKVAQLITFLLGSLAVAGYTPLAAAGAVAVALLLSLKQVMHYSLQQLNERELSGALQLLFISLLGGIVSSTAMTISLARLNQQRGLHAMLACGLLATSALMFPRVLLEVGVVNSQLLPRLIWPLGVAALVYAGGALMYFRLAGDPREESAEPPLKNPFELAPALRFAVLLVLILFLVEAARRGLGDVGVYLVALLSGLADVDT